MPRTVFLYRRHAGSCKRKRGDNHRCSCPVWADGLLERRRYHKSLKTADWDAAQKHLTALECGDVLPDKRITEGYESWKEQLRVEESTRKKYTRAIKQLCDFMTAKGLTNLAQMRIEEMDEFRLSRKIARGTLVRELQTWRLWFAWCMDRKWIRDNPAQRIRISGKEKPTPVQPYTQDEIRKILIACDAIGKSAYERIRAKALILVMRHTGLRISDALTLARDRIKDSEILIYTQKTGTPVFIPVHPELSDVLELLPLPRGATKDCSYYFWNGKSRHSALNVAELSLRRVFDLSGVARAHAHRFRHTLAIEILRNGGTIEDVARVLGNTPAVAYRHYAPWCSLYQNRIREIMERVHTAEKLDTAELHRSYTEKKGQLIQ